MIPTPQPLPPTNQSDPERLESASNLHSGTCHTVIGLSRWKAQVSAKLNPEPQPQIFSLEPSELKESENRSPDVCVPKC